MSRVCVFFAEGFEEVEALTVVDLLRRAKVETAMVSITGDLLVTGRSGITVKADVLYENADPENADMLVLPGGMPGVKYLGACEPLTDLLQEFNAGGRYVSAICAAPMVFGALGIVRGRKATIYPGMEEELKGADVTVSEEVVTDGHVTTSRGAGTAIPFALRLIEILCGADTAENVKKGIVFQTTPVL
ncbi:MAG: DJ-1 family glyoxalase III [Lachnospiraceae bacterium]|nr:DJ-1 family glyoxalase III [Lachnospiraceae bacterium]